MPFYFPGIGALANALAIISGGLVGLLFGKKLNKTLCDALLSALGLAVIVIGACGVIGGMLKAAPDGALQTSGTMLLIFSLVTGTLIGSLVGVKKLTERFGAFLKEKAGAADDARFIDSFVSASLTVCIGAMAVIGPIEDGMNGDPSMLFIKALLDGLIIMIFASVTGKGALFSAIPVLAVEGTLTLLASAARPLFTDVVVANMSFVGAVLILCVGVNLMFDKKINVADMLPAVFAAIPFTYLFADL